MDLVVEIAREFWGVLTDMAPYLLFGFFIAGLLSVMVTPELVERHLGGRGLGSIFKASLFGVPLPLCSCGVIPVAASLRRHGAGRGATAAFLISTPQTGVDSMAATFGLLGPVFAVFRPIAALVSGVLGGTVIELAGGKGAEPDPGGAVCTDECCSPRAGRAGWLRVLHYGFVTLPRDIGRALLVGLLIAGLITALVPDSFFSSVLGTGFLSMLAMMLLGIPIYVCATASIPVAVAMMAKGVTPGAALVFLMTGPATNVAAIATIWKVLGRRTALLYLAVVAVTALVSGLVFDAFIVAGHVPHEHGGHAMLPESAKVLAACVLLGILGAGLVRRRPHRHADATDGALRLGIEGMTCSRCREAVERALREAPGVTRADVNVDTGAAVVAGHDVDVAGLIQAVEALGYKATESTSV